MPAAPTRIEPVFRAKIWGSLELEPWFERPDDLIGEVWFPPPPEIPILVKFLFTSDRLSVQVHPNDAYARRRENSAGKSEMWHILRAAAGASIALGFEKPITRQRLRDAALSGEIEKLVRWIPVAAGDTYYTPAGTVHALGGGLALCEIQQQSDITYRLYDYGRPRALHLSQALEVAELGVHPGAAIPEPAGAGREVLVRSEHFTTELLRFADKAEYTAERLHLLIAIEGRGAFGEQAFRQGEVWVVPAGCRFALKPALPVRLLRTS